MNFTKKDFVSSIITGLTAGLLGWWILVFSGVPGFFGFSHAILVIGVPVVWIIGVRLGYFLSRWIVFFNQFGKFAAVGFTNFAVDAGVLDGLLFLADITKGPKYTIFKLVSFIIALTHSYFWNRFWVFGSVNQSRTMEFGKFAVVAVGSAIINVSAASIVVNLINPQFGLDPNAWANVGSVVGSAVALILSFIGFKIGVFKK